MSSPQFSNLTAYAARLDELVPDQRGNLTAHDFVKQALKEYSEDYPAYETQDIGDGATKEWILFPATSPFTRWDQGFSDLFPVEIERLDSNSAPYKPRTFMRQRLDSEAYGDWWFERRYTTVLQTVLVFVVAPPSQKLRVRFARRWIVNDASTPVSEVPENHQEAVVYLAAAYKCSALEMQYRNTVDTATGSDIFSGQDVADRYKSSAQTWRDRYEDIIGLGGDAVVETGQARIGHMRVFQRGLRP